MAIQSSPSCLCALLCALLIAPAACYTGAVASRRGAVRTCRVRALEPISTALAGGTAAAAFAAGLVPPSLLLLSKDGEIREAKAEAADANAEVARLREGFDSLITALELEIDVVDVELDELLTAGQRAAKKRRDELSALQEKNAVQIKALKDLLGDYADKLELQQNTFKRLSSVAESAQLESLALKERARLLEGRLAAANAQLGKVQVDSEKNWFEKIMTG